MRNQYKGKHLKLWTPATYRIEVEGYLEESVSDRLGGLRIDTHKRKDQTTVTILVGRVRDQAELSGILNSLYEMHLPILSVENIKDANDVCEKLQDPDELSQSGPEAAEIKK